ncbi:MAG: fumarylacetoacetate hydrolase family protein [Spirochaetota bacterium]
MIVLYPTPAGVLLHDPAGSGPLARCPALSWDELFRTDDPIGYVRAHAGEPSTHGSPAAALEVEGSLSLVSRQEVWAAGVTYFKSRTARMEESESAGGGSFYDRIYDAERPELFYKGNARTTVACGEPIRIRDDSRWNVPEPEIVLAVNAHGEIIGYTAGNDVSSRDIEGENPLYLPQAKVYDGSCALGPGLVLAGDEEAASLFDPALEIALEIVRNGKPAFSGTTTLAELKRKPGELVSYLFRNQRFPDGCFLMTGTGIVPDNTFTLEQADEVRITIGVLPALVNAVAPTE